MKLCTCSMCGTIYEDENPQVGAPEYPDMNWPSKMHKFFVQLQEPSEEYWGCPKCGTDGYLNDEVKWAVKTNVRYQILVKNSIEHLSELPEYQEEDSTGWSQLQNLKMLLDDE